MEENWDEDIGGGSAPAQSNSSQGYNPGQGNASSWQPKESTAGNDSSSGGWAPTKSNSNDSGGWAPNSESSGGWAPKSGGYNDDHGDQQRPRGRGGYNDRGGSGGWEPRRGRGGGRGRRDDNSESGGGGWKSRDEGQNDDNESGSGGGWKPRGNSGSQGGWQPRGNRGNYSNNGGDGDSQYKPYGGGRGRGGRSYGDGDNGEDGGGYRSGRGGRSYGDDNGEEGGGYRRGRGGGRGRGGRSFGEEDGEDGGGYGRGRSGGGRGRGGRDYGDGENGDGEERKERPPLYIPKERADDDESLFQTIPSGINFSRYEDIDVKVSGENIPPKINSFEESGLRQFLLENVKKSKYLIPTPVQKYALPIIMAKRDLMACAQTGSGKTAAFLLPIIENLMAGEAQSASYKDVQEPYAVILAPTRELALQIYNEAKKFTHGSIIRSCVAYGGTSVGHQLRQLENGCHILVATPGRMMDFVDRGKLSFAQLKYYVLDEADRMLDTGFREQAEKVAELSKSSQVDERHTLMFSATFPKDVQELARKLLKPDYLFLTVGMIGGANADVEQIIMKVTKREKIDTLKSLIDDDTDRTLVFVELKKVADFLGTNLSLTTKKTTTIHGDRYQDQRELALETFRSGEMKVLVATSVAARGLDIQDVRHVVNYDLPKTIEEYVHRIGRTGRVGNIGKATSFYDPDIDGRIAADLVKVLADANQNVPDWLQEEAASGGYNSNATYDPSRFGGSDIRNFRGKSEMTHVDSGDQWGQEPAAQMGGAEAVEEQWD